SELHKGIPCRQWRQLVAEPRRTPSQPFRPQFGVAHIHIIKSELGSTTRADVVIVRRILHLAKATHRTIVVIHHRPHSHRKYFSEPPFFFTWPTATFHFGHLHCWSVSLLWLVADRGILSGAWPTRVANW